jgi:hypothetical protein
LVVPLMMPAAHSMRLAVRPSRNALMMGMPPATAASKATMTPFLLGGGENLRAMHGEQRLVGSDHVLAIGDRLHDHFLGHTVATDQLDNDVDFRIIDQRKGIIGHAGRATGDLLGQLDVLVGDGRNANRTAGTAGNFLRVALENSPGATADGADADKANIDGFH